MRAYERLLQYVQVHTTSDPLSGTHPSTQRQFDLARMLVEELQALGVEDAAVDEHCYVYGTLPSTPGCEDRPALGLIAHMDTAPDASGENVRPVLHQDYDGRDVTLPATGAVMRVKDFPFLASMKGETLITTDGSTLLGADDKAGVAEIMTSVEPPPQPRGVHRLHDGQEPLVFRHPVHIVLGVLRYRIGVSLIGTGGLAEGLHHLDAAHILHNGVCHATAHLHRPLPAGPVVLGTLHGYQHTHYRSHQRCKPHPPIQHKNIDRDSKRYQQVGGHLRQQVGQGGLHALYPVHDGGLVLAGWGIQNGAHGHPA